MFLKLIDVVFPTSDLSHPITTPALYLMTYVFVKARLTDVQTIARGIILIDTVFNYVKLSKRYIPELSLFISRVLFEAVAANISLNKFTASALNMERYKNGHLYISDNCEDIACHPIRISLLSESYQGEEFATTSMKLSCIKNVLLLCKKFVALYGELETFKEIIEPIRVLIAHLPLQNYPPTLKTLHCDLVDLIRSKEAGEKVPLKLQARKPIPLTLLEPQYEEVNNDVFRKRGGDKAKNEHDKLKYKVKRELKGAVKEIRKDSHFLAKERLNEQLAKDATRKRKVKELKAALESEGRYVKELEKGGKKKK